MVDAVDSSGPIFVIDGWELWVRAGGAERRGGFFTRWRSGGRGRQGTGKVLSDVSEFL